MFPNENSSATNCITIDFRAKNYVCTCKITTEKSFILQSRLQMYRLVFNQVQNNMFTAKPNLKQVKFATRITTRPGF